MSGCNHCHSCGGCGEFVLHPGEVAILRKLHQIPFLPVGRETASDRPIYLEDSDYSVSEYGDILLCLEKRGLICLDYTQPLSGSDLSAYASCSQCGSFALTAKGQSVAEQLELLGIQEV